MFMFEFDQSFLAWRPDFKKYGNGKDGKHHFNKLQSKLFSKFDRKKILNLPIIFDDKHENNKWFGSDMINELNRQTFVYFWNKLKSCSESTVMNFKIGVNNIKNTLKIAIFSPQSPNTLTFRTWCFIDKNDNFEIVYKQLILYLNTLTKSAFTFTSANDDVDVDYDELKYLIYFIDDDTYSSISNDMIGNLKNNVEINAASVSKFAGKYDLDCEVQHGVDLEGYLEDGDNDDICYLFVECKNYFLIENDGVCCGQYQPQWTIKNNNNNGNNNNNNKENDFIVHWETEFNGLKQDACDKCAILNDDKLSLGFGFDRDLCIDEADDVDARWSEMIDDDIKTTIIVVNGELDPLAVGRNLICDDNDTDDAEHKEIETKEDEDITDLEITQSKTRTITQSHIDSEWQRIEQHINQNTSNIIKNNSKNTEKQMDFLVLNLFSRKQIAKVAKEKELEIPPIGEDSLKSFEMLFNHLIKSMKSEGYNKGTQIFESVLNAQTSLLSTSDIDSSYKQMKTVLISIRPFDINKMVKLYGEAEETSKQVSNENIILLLGHTGAGKSTTIHFLAGSQLQKDKITDHIDVIKAAPGTKKVKTALKFTESVTRFISGVPLSLQGTGVTVGDRQVRKGRIFLCDSPGFDDSSGAEVDVANGLGILKAVRLTKRVRVLLVISASDMGQRCQGLKKLANTLGQILPNLTEHLKSGAIDFIFTKINGADPCKKIQTIFTHIVNDEDLESNVEISNSLDAIIRYVIKRAKKKKLIVLNPIQDDRNSVLETLVGDDDINWIVSPGDEFNSFTTDSSMALIKQQILKHRESILKSVTNGQYDAINVKLNELKSLNNVLPLKSIVDNVNDCVATVCNAWNKRCESVINKIKISSVHRSLGEFNGDLVMYRNVINDMKEHHILRQQHLVYKMVQINQNDKNENSNINRNSSDGETKDGKIKDQLDNAAKDVKYLEQILISLFGMIEANCNLNNESEGNELNLGRLLEFKKIFPDLFEQRYKDKARQIRDDADQVAKKCEMILNSKDNDNMNGNGNETGLHDYSSFFTNLVILGHAFHIYEQYGDPCKIGKLMQELNAKFIDHLENLRKNVQETFPSLVVEPNSASTTRKGMNMFKNLECACQVFANGFSSENGINIHELRGKCNEIYNDTEKHMVSYCKMLIGEVSKQVTTKNWDVLTDDSMGNDEVKVDKRSKMQNIHRDVKYANQIRNLNQTVRWKTSEMYYRLIQHLIGVLERTRQIANNIIESIENDPDTAKYGQLVNCIVVIMDSDWVFDFEAATDLSDDDGNVSNYNDNNNVDDADDGKCSGQISDTNKGRKENKILAKVEKKLLQHMDRLCSEIDTITIKLGDKECLLFVKKMMNQLKNMSKLAEILPKITEKSDQIVTTLENDVAHVLYSIQKEFDLSKKNGSNSTEIRLLKALSNYSTYLLDVCKKHKIKRDLSLNEILKQLKNGLTKNKEEEEKFVRQLNTHNEQREKLRTTLKLIANHDNARRKKSDDENSHGIMHSLKKNFLPSSSSGDEGFLRKHKTNEKDLDGRRQQLLRLDGERDKCEKQLRKLKNEKIQLKESINGVNQIVDIENDLKDINFEWTREKLIECRKNNTFKIEIEKITKGNGNQNESKQFISNFNKRKANQSLIFINSCMSSKIKWRRARIINRTSKESMDEEKLSGDSKEEDKLTMDQLVVETDDILKRHLVKYGKTIIEEISSTFEKLIDVDTNSGTNENKNNDVNDNVSGLSQLGNDLSDMLRDLCQIESRYPMLMAYLDEDQEGSILAEWPDKMSQGLTQFRTRLVQYKQCNDVKLHIGIRRANILSKIDWFLKQKGCVNNGFGDVYFDHQNQFHDNVGYSDIKDGIKDEDFYKVGTALGQLINVINVTQGAPGNYKVILNQAKQELSRKLDQIYNLRKIQIIKLPNEINAAKEQITTLREYYHKIQEAQSYCVVHLDEKDQQKLAKIDDDSNKLLENWMDNVLSNVTQLIESYQFEDAYTKIETIKSITTLTFMNFEANDRYKALETAIETQCDKLVEKYKAIELKEKEYSPYTQCPLKRLYVKLAPLLDKRAKIRQVWDTIISDVMDKFRGELKTARNSDVQENERIVRLCESVLTSLPQETSEILEQELKHCQADIKKKKTYQDEKLEQIQASGDFGALNTFLNQMLQAKDEQRASKIERSVLHQVSSLENAMYAKFDKFDSSAMTDYDRMIQLYESFNGVSVDPGAITGVVGSATPGHDEVGAVSVSYRNFNYQLRTKCDHIGKELTQQYVKLCQNVEIDGVTTQEDIKQLEIKIEFFMEVRKNRHLSFGNDSLKGASDKLNEKFVEYFGELKKKFESSIKSIVDSPNDRSVHLNQIQYILDILLLYQHSTMFIKLNINDKIVQYKDAVNQFGGIINDACAKIMNKKLKNEETDKHEQQRKEYFSDVNDALTLLVICSEQHMILCSKHLNLDIRTQYLQKIWELLGRQVQELITEIGKHVDNSNYSFSKEKNLKIIDVNYNILSIFNELVVATMTKATTAGEQIRRKITNIKDKIEDALLQICTTCQQKQNIAAPEQFAVHLLRLHMASQILISFRNLANDYVNECLRYYKKQKAHGITPLAIILESTSDVWGAMLVARHAVFRGQAIAKFNKLTNEHGIEYVLNHIGCNDKSINKDRILDRHNTCITIYKSIIDAYLRPGLKYDGIVSDCRQLAHKTKTLINWNKDVSILSAVGNAAKNVVNTLMGKGTRSNGKNTNTYMNTMYCWDNRIKGNLIAIIAHVFALWTLQNAEEYFASSGDVDDPNSFLMQPRAAQVVSILRLLSIDYDDRNKEGLRQEKLQRHLIEIGTGEGKSLTLGVSACVLALVGFEVSCACYSSYLSDRDYESFEQLFVAFGVSNYIHYGTFDQLCEQVINSDGNVREMVENMILTRRRNNANHEKKDDNNYENKHNNDDEKYMYVGNNNRGKILLIDEVDVFFSKDFYGNNYTPAAKLKCAEIDALLDLIWKKYESSTNKNHFHSKRTFVEITRSKEYFQCQKVFGELWCPLLDESIKDMLADIGEFQSTDYQVHNGKIGYKYLDTIETNMLKGYKTLFSYYFEHKENEISVECLNENKYIWLSCGTFSYAEIAKNFDIILGVTGTLSTLSKAQQNVMKETYNISRHSYMPSLFGQHHFEFDARKDVKLFSSLRYYENLKEEIRSRLNDHKSARCVFVFFEDNKKLNDFHQSKEFAPFRQSDKVLLMSEKLNKNEKSLCIVQSCSSGSILLATKSFGRGTDFQVRDKIVRNNGGPHVIQTFLSEEKSEEKQIMGRTARQGGNGSYSMVLMKPELEKFDIKLDDDDVNDNKELEPDKLYQTLDDKRNAVFNKHYANNTQFVTSAKQSHENAMGLLRSIHSGDSLLAKQILLELNLGSYLGDECTKVAVLMDATGSMGDLLHKTKTSISAMINRISLILQENNMDPKSFELQFVAYRNYNAPWEKLLEYSGWSSDANELIKFISGIKANYGMGNEAIEIAFNYINELINKEKDDISQIILIGDRAPNTKEDVQHKRAKREEKYWQTTKFSNATYWEDELKNITKHQVPVHAFYLDEKAKACFSQIAKRTNGKCGKLDINSNRGGQALTDLVSKQVLLSSGGDDLVRAYDKKFGSARI